MIDMETGILPCTLNTQPMHTEYTLNTQIIKTINPVCDVNYLRRQFWVLLGTVTSVACRLSAECPPNLKKTPPEAHRRGGYNSSAQHSPA